MSKTPAWAIPEDGSRGTCELCGHQSRNLGLLDGELLCEDCREYTKMFSAKEPTKAKSR